MRCPKMVLRDTATMLIVRVYALSCICSYTLVDHAKVEAGLESLTR
jgi:hypothetical protein